jgi:hypothetical protein
MSGNGNVVQIGDFLKKPNRIRTDLEDRISLKKKLLRNVNVRDSDLDYDVIDESFHKEVLGYIFDCVGLSSVNTFFSNKLGVGINLNLISIVENSFVGDDYQRQRYFVRTFFNAENILQTQLVYENSEFLTLPNPHIEIYPEIGEASLEYIKRINTLELDYSNFPNEIRIIGERQIVGLDIPFELTPEFSFDEIGILVKDFFSYTTELDYEYE